MNRYLIAFYPVHPADHFVIWNLDNPDYENEERIKNAYDLYSDARDRRKCKDGEIFSYNNTFWFVVKCNGYREAFDIFWSKLRKEN